jgi:hypothetical protein
LTKEHYENSHLIQFSVQGCFYCNFTFLFEENQEIYFAKEKGILFLTKSTRKELNISIHQQNITWENPCFGN